MLAHVDDVALGGVPSHERSWAAGGRLMPGRGQSSRAVRADAARGRLVLDVPVRDPSWFHPIRKDVVLGPGQTTKELLRIPQGDAVGGSPLGVPIDARIPPAVSIDVDLSAVPLNHRVLFVGVTGSGADALTAPVTSNPATISALVQAWPHVAMRLVRVANRPA